MAKLSILLACLALGGCALTPEQADRLSAVGTALQDTSDPAPKLSGGCYLKSQSDSGFNRLCFYDCNGSTAATTIRVSALCPLTM